MALPQVLTAEATPIDRPKKRKLSSVVDLAAESHARPSVAPSHELSENKNEASLDIEDEESNDDEDGDDGSLLEDIVDLVDSEPYISDGSEGLSSAEAAALRALLRREGVDRFIQEVLVERHMDPRAVGMAFGLNPSLGVDEDMFLQIFSVALIRAQYKREKLEQFNTIEDAAALLQRSRNIMVVTGAGISTSLGIPDFRSKGTGFYERIRDMGYADAEEVFEITNFDDDPGIFYSLAGDILPDLKRYSPTHAFIRSLQDHGRLQTNYTQNIDNLEALAGIEENKLIQCHGSFATATCRKCRHQVQGVEIFQDIRDKRVAYCKRCVAELEKPNPPPVPQKRSAFGSKSKSDDDDSDDDIPQPGVMKPDITFFGEQLPDTFFKRFTEEDAKSTDLVIVIGTSLKVAPVSEMPNYIPHHVPHIFISREPIQHVNFDIQLLGSCDDVVVELSRRAGWGLTHDMIPIDRELEVLPVEGSGHCWVVVPKINRSIGAEVEKTIDLTTTGNEEQNIPVSQHASTHAGNKNDRSSSSEDTSDSADVGVNAEHGGKVLFSDKTPG